VVEGFGGLTTKLWILLHKVLFFLLSEEIK